MPATAKAAEPVATPDQLEFTIDLRGRPAHETPLTREEAEAMWRLGFRFAIFQPGQGEFVLSIPYTTLWDMGRDRLTFRQAFHPTSAALPNLGGEPELHH